MTALTWAIRLIIFAFLVVFAIGNTETVTLHFLFGYLWDAPLVILLLAFFAAGAVLGVLSLLGVIFRLRREVARLKRAQNAPAVVPSEVVQPPVL